MIVVDNKDWHFKGYRILGIQATTAEKLSLDQIDMKHVRGLYCYLLEVQATGRLLVALRRTTDCP